jgi:hypothetical protein
MTAIKSHHTRVFERLMYEHRSALIDALAGGIPADYPGYRQLVGQVQGINDALRISEEADFSLSGDEPNAGA